MKGTIKRTLIILGILGTSTFLFQDIDLAVAKDPDYPTKPITYYIGFAAGGITDIVVRPLLEATSKHLGQPFIVINKPGAGSSLAAMTVMSAKPDGYTIGSFSGSSLLVIPHSEASPYKDLSGFELIMSYARQTFPLKIRADVPWKNWKEFIESARKNPKAAKIGIVGARSMSPMGIALWEVEQRERVEFTYIVFKGSNEGLNNLLGGHVPLESSSMDIASAEYLKEGKIRILVYMSKEKVPGYEDIPSFAELYGFAPPNVMGIWGPKGIPNYALEKLNNALAKGIRDPHFIEVMNRTYTPIVYQNRNEINKEAKEMFPKVGDIVKTLRAQEAKEAK